MFLFYTRSSIASKESEEVIACFNKDSEVRSFLTKITIPEAIYRERPREYDLMGKIVCRRATLSDTNSIGGLFVNNSFSSMNLSIVRPPALQTELYGWDCPCP
ncbi:hypothetical protein TNCV_1901151 [Trichonephila clavipes]|nr:hypothetical protein TNCV_1901151 [Trichonephila clavipes]